LNFRRRRRLGASPPNRSPASLLALILGLSTLALLAFPAWAPAIRDPTTGFRLTGTQVANLASDRAPLTIAPVDDVVDASTGRRLYSRLAFERHAIGSLTKLMTALLTVQTLSLNRVVTVSGKAASTPGSTMYLVQGDRLTVRTLLYGLLIPSGNDAAEELAETMAGDDRGFARIANRQARVYHLRCSHFVTPHGLDARGQYSCAADVATLTRLVLRVPLLAKIVRTKEIVVSGVVKGEIFPLANTNLLLGNYPGILGVKTGTTDEAGAALSAASRQTGHVMICVVLGSTDYGRFSDCASLLTFGSQDFVWPSAADTMWSTRSLEAHVRPVAAPVPRWESAWLAVGRKGLISVPFDSH